MSQTATELFPQHNNVEIVVHIEEMLDDLQRRELTNFLEATDGISTAEFCPLRYHLMLVQYDRERMNSQDILGHVVSRDINARLIGPI
jgi:hypothetical protein